MANDKYVAIAQQHYGPKVIREPFFYIKHIFIKPWNRNLEKLPNKCGVFQTHQLKKIGEVYIIMAPNGHDLLIGRI